MADDPIKRLRAEMEAAPPPKKVTKVNRTLYLTEPQFSQFADYCRKIKRSPSEVVDRLISMYMADANDLGDSA
jgi:hypothetical protein